MAHYGIERLDYWRPLADDVVGDIYAVGRLRVLNLRLRHNVPSIVRRPCVAALGGGAAARSRRMRPNVSLSRAWGRVPEGRVRGAGLLLVDVEAHDKLADLSIEPLGLLHVADVAGSRNYHQPGAPDAIAHHLAGAERRPLVVVAPDQ